jgi:curved DNA-binding protein CbpA
MVPPYAILEVDELADDETIKKAYLLKVKECPPERDPLGFQRIRRAFELIKTRKDRKKYQLFHYGAPDLELLNEKWLSADTHQRPGKQTITNILCSAVKSYKIDKG